MIYRRETEISFQKNQNLNGSILDQHLMNKLGHKVDGVVHAAGIKYANQSSINPQTFYEINLVGSINVAMAARNSRKKIIVFSSSCAIYGNSIYNPALEKSPKNPISPYGRSKLMAETIFEDFADAYGLRYVALRFFNVIGASEFGSYDKSKFNLFPNICRSIRDSSTFEIFGTNLQTPDGSCVRDYVDVNDVSRAHLIVIEKLIQELSIGREYNLGTGKGISTLEIIRQFEKQLSIKVLVASQGLRKGDPLEIFADASLAEKDLNWRPEIDLGFSVHSQFRLFRENINSKDF
jgi:UDP-glucose 4-epimerase